MLWKDLPVAKLDAFFVFSTYFYSIFFIGGFSAFVNNRVSMPICTVYVLQCSCIKRKKDFTLGCNLCPTRRIALFCLFLSLASLLHLCAMFKAKTCMLNEREQLPTVSQNAVGEGSVPLLDQGLEIPHKTKTGPFPLGNLTLSLCFPGAKALERYT